jgi:hypothetical protein
MMRKTLYTLAGLLLSAALLYAADTAVTALTNLATATTDDLLYIVEDPGGTPAPRKITMANLYASTKTLTNTTLDAEGTGNVLTTVSEIPLPVVSCSGLTGSLIWDTLATLAPTPTCTAGTTNTTMMRGVADFPDTDGDYSIQQTTWLPEDWSGVVDAYFIWRTTATANNVVWQIQTACRANGEVDDLAWNTASTVTDAAAGTTLFLNTASIAGITTTGCAAGELMHFRVLRNRTHASDTMAAAVSLAMVKLKVRRAQ